jgi:hypothetical protein
MQKKMLMGSCFALLGLVGAVQAATEFPQGLVPLELARELGGIDGQYYSSLPDNFPLANLDLDLNLQVIGSVQQGNAFSAVLLRSEASATDVANALAPALMNSGWVVLYSHTSQNERIAQLCHNQLGDVTLSVHDEADGARLSVMLGYRSNLAPQRDCALEKSRQDAEAAKWDFLSQQIPVLELPSNALQLPRPPVGITGVTSGSSGVEMRRDTLAQLPDSSAAALYELLAAQMTEQGWSEDSGGDGDSTATGLWLRSATMTPGAAAGLRYDLLSSLSVIDHGTDRYEIKVTLQSGTLQDCSVSSPIVLDCVQRDPGMPQLGIRGIPAGYRPTVTP